MQVPSLVDVDRALVAKGGLREFVQLAWPVLEPATELSWNWHLDAVCDHLQAVLEGDLKRLLIAVPPGTMKSLLSSVFAPAYQWGPGGRPEYRMIFASYSGTLSSRDSLRCRRLIESPWYRGRWGHAFSLAGDQNVKTRYETDKTGVRVATSVGGTVTGDRGDLIVCDDLLDRKRAESEAHRQEASDFFWETLPSRVNNLERDAFVVIAQRLHARDTIGEILERAPERWEKLVLPLEFEPERRCATSLGFSDPRTELDEVLHPERFPDEVVANLKADLGSYAYAGQYQQRPRPREGAMFHRAWFEVVDAVPAGTIDVRGWDLAATESSGRNDPSWTAGVRVSRAPDGTFYVRHVERLRGSPERVERAIKATATQDGVDVLVSLPKDPGQAGKSQAMYLTRQLAGFQVRTTPESGSKEVRAGIVAAQAEAGNVKVVRGKWNADFLSEVEDFPTGAHDDQVDALSRAFAELVRPTHRRATFARPRAVTS